MQFFFNCDIAPLSRAAPRSLQLAGGSEAVPYDAVVVCAGVASAALFKPLGVRIPIAPVYGHSISAAIREPLNAPRSCHGRTLQGRDQPVGPARARGR